MQVELLGWLSHSSVVLHDSLDVRLSSRELGHRSGLGSYPATGDASRRRRQPMTTDKIQHLRHRLTFGFIPLSSLAGWASNVLISFWVLRWAFHDHVPPVAATSSRPSKKFDCMTARVVRRGWTKRMLHIFTWSSIPPTLSDCLVSFIPL